jgi:GT2 family glycosyltransferase
MTQSPTGHIQASVVLCVKDGEATLAAQLDALASQTFTGKWEVVVVDNLSSDRSAEIASSFTGRLPNLRIVEASDRAGLSYARNVGARAARGPVLAFCDADDRVQPQWLDALVRACGPGVLVGGALNLDGNDSNSVYWRSQDLTPAGLPGPHAFLPHVIGANFAMWRDAFLGVDGCDEDFVACWDDVDLSWRALSAGCRMVFVEDAVVDYQLRSSVRGSMQQMYSYGRAEVLLYCKHRPAMARNKTRDVAAVYWFLISRSHQLMRGRRVRGRWLSVAAYRMGRLRGSWDERVWFP